MHEVNRRMNQRRNEWLGLINARINHQDQRERRTSKSRNEHSAFEMIHFHDLGTTFLPLERYI